MKLRVEAIQEDIDLGVASLCGSCPIALAINRIIHPDHRAHVTGTYITVKTPTSTYRCLTPGVAAKFIHAFDRDGRRAVQPITFDIELTEVRPRQYRA